MQSVPALLEIIRCSSRYYVKCLLNYYITYKNIKKLFFANWHSISSSMRWLREHYRNGRPYSLQNIEQLISATTASMVTYGISTSHSLSNGGGPGGSVVQMTRPEKFFWLKETWKITDIWKKKENYMYVQNGNEF